MSALPMHTIHRITMNEGARPPEAAYGAARGWAPCRPDESYVVVRPHIYPPDHPGYDLLAYRLFEEGPR